MKWEEGEFCRVGLKQQRGEDELKNGTEDERPHRRTDETLLTDKAEICCWQADGPKGDWGTIWQSGRQEQTCERLCWSNCVLLLFSKKPRWVSTPRSACRSVMVVGVMHKHIFDVCGFLCVCGCCADSSRGHWPRRRNSWHGFVSFPRPVCFIYSTIYHVKVHVDWTSGQQNLTLCSLLIPSMASAQL